MALDSIGANWRHNYQRSIYYFEGAVGSVSSANVFRHDGRIFTFILNNGIYYPQADISDRLTGSSATGWMYVSAETEEIELYDTDGRLLSIRSRAGRTHTLHYDSDGRLQSVSDDFGQSIAFTYSLPAGDLNGVQRIVAMADTAGNAYQYGFGANATLTSVTYPDSTIKQYQYAGPTARALTGIVDESGGTYATYAYDAYGQATLSAHAAGAEQVSIIYTKTGDLQLGPAYVTDSLGATRTYQYGFVLGVPKILSITQPGSSGSGTASQIFSYDLNGNTIGKTDFAGNLTCYAYDLSRNLETVRIEGFASTVSNCPTNLASYTPAVGTRERKFTTFWNGSFRLPSTITEPNRITSFTYDANGNQHTKILTDTTVTPNVSRTWAYTYDGYGRMLTALGPRTDVLDKTTYAYYTCTTGYQCGQVQTLTNVLGQVTTFLTYNAHGQPLTITASP